MEQESLIRFGVFFGLLLVLSLLEAMFERKSRVQARSDRWLSNLGLGVVNTLTVMAMGLAMPIMVTGAAIWSESRQFGLLYLIDAPVWVEVAFTVIILDLVIWTQHWASHRIPVLWRLHRVHHSDRDLDASSGVRFHPLEIAFSIFVKIIAVIALGPIVLAVIIYEITLNGMALFTHANLRLPLWLDRVLRVVVVTPDMHRVHHAIDRAEHDMNYGNLLSLWDRIFGTYQAQPKHGHDEMVLGLHWQDARTSRFGWLLRLPFARK